MDNQLTPDDLEANKEYFIKFYYLNGYKDENNNEYNGQYDGIYMCLHEEYHWITECNVYDFINIENKKIRLVYNTNKLQFYNVCSYSIMCNIFELTNEYILK